MRELSPWVSPHCWATCASSKGTHAFGAGRNVGLVSGVSQINCAQGKNPPELGGLCIHVPKWVKSWGWAVAQLVTALPSWERSRFNPQLHKKQTWWRTTVIPAFGRRKGGGHPCLCSKSWPSWFSGDLVSKRSRNELILDSQNSLYIFCSFSALKVGSREQLFSEK